MFRLSVLLSSHLLSVIFLFPFVSITAKIWEPKEAPNDFVNTMSSEIIKKHLEDLKGQKEFDPDFIDLLATSNATGEDGKETTVKILDAIKKRYVESKENNS